MSKALDKSRKIPHTSIDGFASKGLEISYVIGSNLCTLELPGRNPDWFFFSSLLVSKYSKRELKIVFPQTLAQIGNFDTG